MNPRPDIAMQAAFLFLGLLAVSMIPPTCSNTVKSAGRLVEEAWRMIGMGGSPNCTDFKSQSGQEIFVAVMTRGLRGGYFLDVGAYDGISGSNSFFLETQLGWDGLCIEGGRNNSKLLRKLGRRCKTVEAVVVHAEGDCLFQEFFSLGQVVSAPNDYTHRADCRTLSGIIQEHAVPRTIDFVSLDIEGAEVLALDGYPFNTHVMRFLAVEHNAYSSGIGHQTALFNKLSNQGYIRVVKDHGFGPDGGGAYEDWYVHSDVLKSVDDKPLWMAFRALSQYCKGDTGAPCWEGCWEAWDEGWGSEGAGLEAGKQGEGAEEGGLAAWRRKLLEQDSVS